MMVTSWVRRDSRPEDFYDLLGRPRFDPAMAELLAASRRDDSGGTHQAAIVHSFEGTIT